MASQAFEREKYAQSQNRLKFAERNQQIETSKQLAEQKRLKEEREDANFFERAGATIADLFTEIGGGLMKGIEGVGDALLSLSNIPIIGNGWLIEKIVGNDNLIEDAVKTDVTQNLWYNWEDSFTNKSYLNEDGAGNFVKQTARGVGQALPSLALAAVPGVGPALSIGYSMASGAGTSVEEAANEGASFDKATLYGTLQGGIEGVIEWATKGLGKGMYSVGKSTAKSFGKNAAKSFGKSVAKSTGQVMLEEATSELIEEGVTALVNPLTRRIYDEDALSAYSDMAFYQNAAEQALVGGVVGGIIGGSSSAIQRYRAGGKENYSIEQSLQELSMLDKKENNLWGNGKLQDNLAGIESQRNAELSNISAQLKRLSETDRAASIKKYGLQDIVDEAGDIIVQNFLASTKSSKGVRTTDISQDNQNNGLIRSNLDAFSPVLRNKYLRFEPTTNLVTQGAQQAKKFITTLSPDARIVITDNLPKNTNALYDPTSKIFYFSNNATPQQIAGHEFTHFLEGTKHYTHLANYILSKVDNLDARIQEKVKLYQNVNTEAKSGKSGKDVAIYEAQTEIVADEMGKLLSDPESVQRIVNENKGVAYRIWQWIKDAVAKLTKRGTNREYYNYIRNAEKLYAQAIRNSVGGIKLSDVKAQFDAIAEFEKLAKQELSQQENVKFDKTAEVRYNIQKAQRDPATVTKEEFEHHYWASANKLITKAEYGQLENIINNRSNLSKLNKSIDGKYMVAVGENGVNNKIIFTDAGIDSYSIDKIIKIGIDNETDLAIVREEIYELESAGISSEDSWLFEVNTPNDFSYIAWSQKRAGTGKNAQDNYGRTDRTGSSKRTEQDDSRYSLKTKDSQGNELSANQIEYFANSQIRDKDGNLLVAYHGTDANFNEFKNKPAQYGRAITDGFYFTLIKSNAQKYGTNVKEVYLNIVNPFYLHNGNGVLAELADREYTISRLVNEYHVETDDTGLPTPKALKKVLQKLGYDGVVSDTIDGTTDIVDTTYSETQIVAFKPNQIKNIDNKNPSDSNDLRYSLKQDSDGNELSTEQQEFFKDSKVRDADGRLSVLYHGTGAEFYKFDLSKSGKSNGVESYIGMWFTPNKDTAQYFADFNANELLDEKPRVLKVYLNIKNPKIYDLNIDNSKAEIDKINSEIEKLRTKTENLPKVIAHALGVREDAPQVGEFIKNAERYQLFNAISWIKDKIQESDIDKIYEAFREKDRTQKLIEEKQTRLDQLKDNEPYYQMKDDMDEFATWMFHPNRNYERGFGRNNQAMAHPEDVAQKYRNSLIDKGYDGIILKNTRMDDSGDQIIAFEPNQIKLTTNKNPTENEDIRFSLKDGQGDYQYSKGQISKYVAEHSKLKAYTKEDAEKVVNTIIADHLNFGNKFGDIRGKTKEQLIAKMWHSLNTASEGYRTNIAFDIANYVVENAVVQDMFRDDQLQPVFHVYDTLKTYIHNVNLDGIKGEIKYHYDKDVSPYAIWGKRKGSRGLSPDQIAMEVAEQGVTFNSDVPAEIFFEMDEMYRDAAKQLKDKTKEKIADIASTEEIQELKQNIVKEILRGYDETGHETKLSETITKYSDRISSLKQGIKDIRKYNKAQNNVVSTIERLRDEFVKNKPAGWGVPDQVVRFVRKISRVETWRNNISSTARQTLRELQLQLPSILDETQTEIYPYVDALREISAGQGDLSADELFTLDNILRQFEWQLKNYDKVSFEGKMQSGSELAQKGVNEIIEAQGILKYGGNMFSKLINKVYKNPYDRIAAFGLYRPDSMAVRMYQDILDGDRKRASFVKESADLFDDFFKKHKHYLNDLQNEITLTDGDKSITLTKRQAIALYATSLREQGQNHLFNIDGNEGVIRLLDNKESTRGNSVEAFAKGKDIRVTRTMVSNIIEVLSDADKEYLELAKTFFNEKSKKAKTETDKQLFGITNVEDGFYFPIKVSSDKIYTEAGQRNFNPNQYVLDLGMNKTTKPNASNKIVIDGIDNIIADHMTKMSMYYGYAVPLTAYNRIMNKQVLATSGNDTSHNMRSEIQKIDPEFERYMDRLWQDLQGINRSEKGFLTNLLSKIRWAGANAALGANPKILLTQTLSLSAGLSEFDAKYVAKGMAHFFGEADKLDLAKYSPLMWERMKIGHSVDVTEIRQIGKEIGSKGGKIAAKITKGLDTFTTKPISWMDSNVIQSLWFAAQYEVADTKGKGYEFGTEANKIEAGKRIDEVVLRTQQTSDPIGRSEWMRSDNELVKFARMFTGDALQLTGRLISSVNQFNIAKRMTKSNVESIARQGQTMLKSSKKKLQKAAGAFAINQVFLLAIAMAFKWIKGIDDDDEWGEVAKKEATANIFGLFPFGGMIINKLEGYEPTNMAYDALSDTVEIAETLTNDMFKILNGEYQDPVQRRAAVRKMAINGSKLFGVPTRNIESYIMGIVGKISPTTKEEYDALFKTKSNIYYMEKIKAATANGDEKTANTLINIMFNSRTGKIKDDKVLEVTRDLIESGYEVLPKSVGNKIVYNSETYNLTKRQHTQFMKVYSQANEKVKTMVNSINFKSLDDEAKAKAMKFVYDYFYNLAIEDLLGEDLEEKNILFAEAIPVEQLAVAVSQAKLFQADINNGLVVSGSKKKKVQAFIQRLRLPAVQKYMIMGYLGYSNENGAAQVKSYINSLQLTKSQKEKLYELSGYSK